MLGSVVAETLFGEQVDPTGEIIRIRNQPFRVVGVLASKGQSAMGQDQDDTVFVPYSAVQKKLMGIQHLNNITVSAASAGQTLSTADDIINTLRIRHKIEPGEPDDFMVRTLEEMASVRTETTRTMTVLLASIAGVSLLVGGIGIMNIMLVSVTERTREIGLRMAIGARGKDVLMQFLVEAIVISLFGGLVGIGLAFALGRCARVPRMASGHPARRDPDGVRSSPSHAGVFFGFYPARKSRAPRSDRSVAIRMIIVDC